MTRPSPRTMRPVRRGLMRAAALTATAALLSACTSYAPTPVPSPSATPTPTPTAAAAPPAATCDNALQSYAPTGPAPAASALPPGSTMAAIRQRGRLIVGVSADSYLLGSRNPLTGRVEGFDIDFAHRMAQAILGDPAKLQLRVITAAQRMPVLEAHEVDMVIRNMTITCDRWKKVAFSAVYYQSGQKILTVKGSPIKGLADLAGKRVCAPKGTSSMDNLVRLAPKAIPVPADNHTGCLVKFQSGEAEAITGDDTVLAGLAAQDPYAVVLAEKPFTAEPYGIAMPADKVDLVRFVNAVLEQMRTDGSWARSYAAWLAPTLGKGAGQPAPTYGRTP
jgi:polar amino acid transport system substrate-binding protein